MFPFHLYDLVYTKNEDDSYKVVGKADFKEENGNIKTGTITIHRAYIGRNGTVQIQRAFYDNTLYTIEFED